MKWELPVDYNKLSQKERWMVRTYYANKQGGLCYYCNGPLDRDPPKRILDKPIDWRAFPKGFRHNPTHLHHDHFSGLTKGTVHAYCNAVLWQYEGE